MIRNIVNQAQPGLFICKENVGKACLPPPPPPPLIWKTLLTVLKQVVPKMKTITKFFTKPRWTTSLAMQEWKDLGLTKDLDVMTTRLTQHVSTSLDECAPRRTI